MKKFNKFWLLTLSLIMTAVLAVFAGCANGDSSSGGGANSAISLDKQSVSMYVLESQTLTLTTSSSAKITWESTNTDVVAIVADGKTAQVTAVNRGEATVIATQGKNSVSCKVTVFPLESVFAVTLNSQDMAQLTVGGSYQFDVTATVGGVEVQDVEFKFEVETTSPDGVVTVDENGLVTAVKQGIATVKAYATFGDNVSESVLVTITVFPEDYDNEGQKPEVQEPEEEGGMIEDIFDTEEIMPEPEGPNGMIEDVFGE